MLAYILFYVVVIDTF